MSDDPKLPVKDTETGKFVGQYSEATALHILEEIADGKTLNEVCRSKPGMPHPNTFRKWMVKYPLLAKAYNNALTMSAASLEEEALDTARAIAKMPKDGTHVRAAEVKLGQLRWSAERRDPTKFGTKSQVSIKVPVQIITPIDLNMVGAGPNPQDIYTIEAKPVRALEEAEPYIPDKPLKTNPRRWGHKQKLTPRLSSPKPSPFTKASKKVAEQNHEPPKAEEA